MRAPGPARPRVHGVRYPGGRAGRAGRGRHRLPRLAAELPGAARPSPATGSRSTCRAGPTSRRCPASRPSASSRRWPAASRWSRRPGTTPRACSRRASISSCARDGEEMAAAARAPCWPTPTCAASLAATGRADDPGPPHLRPPGRRAARDRRRDPRTRPRGATRDAHRLLRLEPGLRYWNGAATYYRGLIRALAARGHRITFYEPDAYDRQQHRDIPDPDWARVVVYPADRGRRWPARSRQAAAADLVVKASGVGVFDALLEAAVPGAAPAGQPGRVLGRRRARRRSTASRATRPTRSAPLCPATTSSSPTAAATRWSRAYAALGRAPLRPDLQRARPRRRTTRCRPTRASRPTSASSATGCPTARRGSRSSSSRAARAPAAARASCSAAAAGTTSRCRPTSATSATSTRATTTPSTARRARCSTSTATAWPRYGFSPADPRLRGGRRRRLPHHRRLGGDRAVPRARPRDPGGAGRRRGRGAPRRARRPARARAIGEAAPAARPGRAHLRPPRGRRSRRVLGRAGVAGGGCRHERVVVLGLSITSSWGNGHATTYRGAGARAGRARPRGAVPRARRALVRAPTATCRTRPSARTRALRRPRRAASDASPRRRRRGRRGRSSAPTSPRASRSATGCCATAHGRHGLLRHRHAGHARQARRAATTSTSRRT